MIDPKKLKLPPRKKLPGEKTPTPEDLKRRREKGAKIKAIAREFEAKKAALGARAPAMKKGIRFYLVVLLGMAALGFVVLHHADRAGERRKIDWRIVHAQRSVDALAEALGRFKFHTGRYPDAEDGLGCLALNDNGLKRKYPGWMGRYVQEDIPDPWKRPYVYEPGTNGATTLLSLGPDGARGTADDVLPNPAAFLKPFHDTTWTNGWAPFEERGIIVIDTRRGGGERLGGTGRP